MESLGVPHKPRRYKDNYHRLFAYSKEAYKFFLQLCKEQRNVEWLHYLEATDPQVAITLHKLKCETLDKLINRDC
jgi:hypothetical protein